MDTLQFIMSIVDHLAALAFVICSFLGYTKWAKNHRIHRIVALMPTIINYAESVTSKTENKIDDMIIVAIKKATSILGRELKPYEEEAVKTEAATVINHNNGIPV